MVQVDPELELAWPGASASATACVLNAYVLAALIDRAAQSWIRTQGPPSLTAMNVLTILQGAGEPLQPMVIAERLMVTRGTLTGILGSLESRGYVVRAQHERDGRGQLVLLTKLGERTVRKLRPRMHRAEKSLVKDLTEGERQVLIDLLARMQTAASDLTF